MTLRQPTKRIQQLWFRGVAVNMFACHAKERGFKSRRNRTILGKTLNCRKHERELAQLGRALGLGPRGRRFESCIPDNRLSPILWPLPILALQIGVLFYFTILITNTRKRKRITSCKLNH